MRTQIPNNIFILIVFAFLLSCSSNQQQEKQSNTNLKTKGDNALIKSDLNNDQTKLLKEELEYPKVLTYNDIIEKREEIKEYYDEWSKYNSDSLSLKKRLELDFYDFLTTQFKYMLSQELKLLRNEFFARKGYVFKTKDLQEYFEGFSWYNAITNDASKLGLTKPEKEIIDSIIIYEVKNKNLDDEYFSIQIQEFFKENLKYQYGKHLVEVPSVLFRRNIGYLVVGMSDHNKRWFSGKNLTIELMDTLKKGNMLLGLFGQLMCPAEFCIWGGEIISCDSNLHYIDSYSVEFESYESDIDNKGIVYKFEAPNSSFSKLKLLRITNNGYIEEISR